MLLLLLFIVVCWAISFCADVVGVLLFIVLFSLLMGGGIIIILFWPGLLS